jgi:hypothetical protein
MVQHLLIVLQLILVQMELFLDVLHYQQIVEIENQLKIVNKDLVVQVLIVYGMLQHHLLNV